MIKAVYPSVRTGGSKSLSPLHASPAPCASDTVHGGECSLGGKFQLPIIIVMDHGNPDYAVGSSGIDHWTSHEGLGIRGQVRSSSVDSSVQSHQCPAATTGQPDSQSEMKRDIDFPTLNIRRLPSERRKYYCPVRSKRWTSTRDCTSQIRSSAKTNTVQLFA